MCKQVLEMNAKAVSFLLQGEHDSSHWALQVALEGFRNELNRKTAADNSSSSSSSAGTKRRLSFHQQQEEEDSMMTMMTDNTVLHTVLVGEDITASSAYCDNVITVYNRAFVLKSEIEDEDPYFSRENEHTVPSIILYNMGVSHHILALKTGRSATLSKALQLYTMSFSMLQQASDMLDDFDILVLLALSNNMGAICSELYDQQGAQTSQDMVERVLASSDCLDALEEKDLEFFSLNLMFFSEHQMNILAPAA